MDNVTRYAAINTKVRAIEGKLLKDEDYLNLLSKKSIPEVAAYLKQKTHYSHALEGLDDSKAHRRNLEILIKESHIESLKNLIHYFHDKYREFYRMLFIRYEIEDLKSIMRGIKTGGIGEASKDLYTQIGAFSRVNLDSLLQSKTVYDFINNLNGTVYYDYLRPFMEKKEDVNLFSIGMALDLAYFDMFYRGLNLVDKHDKIVLEQIQGTNVDLLNLQWIYRGLKFYNLPPEELFNYTIAYGKEFSRKDIKALCYSKSLDEFQKSILDTKYSFLFDTKNEKNMFMERRILRYQYFNIKSVKKKGGLDISQVIAYSLLLEMEVRDIISIIENIRYGMPVEEAKKFLIRKL